MMINLIKKNLYYNLLGNFFKSDKEIDIVFYGRSNGLFLDNVKYLYLFFIKNKKILEKNNISFSFLTEDKYTYQNLKKFQLPVNYLSNENLLKPKVLIVDNTHWKTSKFNYIFKKSYKVQLWHGVGFKKFSKSHTDNKIKKKFYFLFFDKIDILLICSQFYKRELFDHSFKYKDYVLAGYPRNEIFFRKEDKLDLINVENSFYHLIKKDHCYNVIYAPTFRDYREFNLLDYINFKELDKRLKKMGVNLILKLHPQDHFQLNKITFENIFLYPPSKDIYPLLKYSDILITDYSSLAMDYLLLNKPIIFFPCDYDKYTKHRQLHLDYFKYAVGEKAFTEEELLKKMELILFKEVDLYKGMREKIVKQVFEEDPTVASKKIFDKILNKFFF